MAASGSRAAGAWHRLLKAQLRSWERSFDSPALQPWRPCCRTFSEASGGGPGDLERGGGGRPDSAPAWPASAQRRERPDSASASSGGPARRNENAASNSKGASETRLPAANSQGPVDFGARLANVTEDDLDNLIAFRNFKGIRGLPPLDSILGQDDEQEKKAQRREAERRKQEEIKKARVKQVDALGRAYATGKRKTSIARVWIAEGGGNITINGKSHDLYFLDLDHRVQVLEPFVVTNTLGSFDVRSTVKGGGVSGQSGALRHGISKALQLFDPALRPLLKSEGMLTRDDRIVERKKPGKAKARKSFQWVKR